MTWSAYRLKEAEYELFLKIELIIRLFAANDMMPAKDVREMLAIELKKLDEIRRMARRSDAHYKKKAPKKRRKRLEDPKDRV